MPALLFLFNLRDGSKLNTFIINRRYQNYIIAKFKEPY